MSMHPMVDTRPLAITQGDACGIGPETIARAVAMGATGAALPRGHLGRQTKNYRSNRR